MARIEVADKAGACFGVERGLRFVEEFAAKADGKPVHTLGPLIHNPIVVSDLEARGVRVTESLDVEPGSVLVLRTHGVPPQVEQAARDAGLEVVDATCPFVKACHLHAWNLSQEGYQVIVVGEYGHPEVEATAAYADALVVSCAEEAAIVPLRRKVAVIVQTTQTQALLREVVAQLVVRTDELRVMNTICSATSERQAAAAELASRSDVMVVVGGKSSANTTHLAEICAQACPNTHHIESPDELEAAWFEGAELVGITAGASTPASHIESVRVAISGFVA